MQGQWKIKVQEMLQICQEELKKTTEIGKKMLTASKASTTLRETYEELGLMVVNEMRKGSFKWENEKVEELLEKISLKEKELEEIEKEVKKIKVSSESEELREKKPSESEELREKKPSESDSPQ